MKKHYTLFLFSLISISLFSQALPSYLPTNGLVGWWPFNGNANDESGNGNNGIVNGASLTSDRFGVAGKAYSFNGGGHYISVPYSSSIGVQQNISISVWLLMNGGGCNPRILEINSTYSQCGGYTLITNGTSNVSRTINTGFGNCSSGYFSTTSQSLSALQWHHLAYTVDNILGVAKVYFDGVLISTYSGSTFQGVNYNNNPLTLGNINPDRCDWWGGLLDDIAIYSRALTQEEITALYTGTPNNGGGGGSSSANPVPPGIPYQAVVRNANGQVAANAAVTSRFTLHQTTADGAVEYQETHALITNAQGLMATVLGQGTAVQNTFAAINWANTTKFLQVEVDLGNGYVDLGTQQLMSVPFAQRAAAAGTIENGTLPIFSDNAAALAGGLSVGKLYRTSTGDLKIVY